MEIHKYHFILFNALIQHLNKGKNYQIDNIYALCNKYYQNIVQIKRHLRAASCAGRCLLTSCFVQGSQCEPPRRVRAVPWTAPSFPHACASFRLWHRSDRRPPRPFCSSNSWGTESGTPRCSETRRSRWERSLRALDPAAAWPRQSSSR